MATTSSSHVDEDIIIARRKEEIDALHAFYGDQLLPSLRTHSTQSSSSACSPVSPRGPWFIELITNDNADGPGWKGPVPTLEIRLPCHYPLALDAGSLDPAPPLPILHHTDSYLSAERRQIVLDELNSMFEPDLEVAILWAERCRREFLDFQQSDFSGNDVGSNDAENESKCWHDDSVSHTPRKMVMMFLTYNHLIHGKAHKKESQIVDLAADMGLIGIVVFGTPGLIGVMICDSQDDLVGKKSNHTAQKHCISTTRPIVMEFVKECSRIGKRATVLPYELEFCEKGFSCNKEFDTNEYHDLGNNIKNTGNKKKNRGKEPKNEKKEKCKQKGVRPLLSDLLGANRTVESSGSGPLQISKTGLNRFSSCVDLKHILLEHGLGENTFKKIIGLA